MKIREFNGNAAHHPPGDEGSVTMANVICFVPRQRRASIRRQADRLPVSKTIVPRDPHFAIEPDTGNS